MRSPAQLRSARSSSSACGQNPDEGAASIELVVLFPVVLLATFGLLQGALWYHAREVASTAATTAVVSARADGGTVADGQQSADALLSQTGDVLSDVQVSVTRSDDRVLATVSGRSVSLLPGIAGPAVEQIASGSVERFTSRGVR